MQQGGQCAEAEERLEHILADSGLDLAGDGSFLLDENFGYLVANMVSDAQKHLVQALSELEFAYTLQTLSKLRPHQPTSATLDDVIDLAADSALISKPSDWTAVLMLLNDCGHGISAFMLCNALKNNAKACRLGVPSRQSLEKCYVEHTRSQRFPNWPTPQRGVGKMARYHAIATKVLPIINAMRA